MSARKLVITAVILGMLLFSQVYPVMSAAAFSPGNTTDPILARPAERPFLLQKTITLADLGYKKDETLQGILVDRVYAINWPQAWEPKRGNAFTVEFSHSPALKMYSSLTVDWNGVRLGSVLLTPENVDRGSLRVSIPEEQIEQGYNQLRIQLYMGIHEDRCEDPDNPATWATVHSSSFFVLQYDIKPPETDLSLYPYPLIDAGGIVENQVTFVIPDSPSIAEVEALAMVNSKLGQLAAWRILTVDVIPEAVRVSQTPMKGDIVYVGQANRLSVLRNAELPFVKFQNGEAVFTDLQGQPVPKEAGILWEQISKDDPTAVEMIVTGATEQAMLVAAQTLASSIAYPRLQGQLGVILSIPEPEPTSGQFKQIISLEELGYEDQTAHGTRVQTLNYVLPLPMEWQVLSEAILDLHFAHSKLLHPERSSLTISVNGSPVGSILLTNENADDGHASFTIPSRSLKIGDNKISVTSNIQLIDNYVDKGDCARDYYTEAWIVVYSDTNLKLPSGPASVTLNLADYPFAFFGTPNLTDLVFVVPDSPGLVEAKSVAIITARLGRSAEGETLYPKVVSSSAVDSAAEKIPFQFLIGQPTRNQAIYALNSILPLPFIEGTDNPVPSEKVAQVLNLNGKIGYIEATLTDDAKPRLVITGNSEEGVLWAANALSNPLLMRDLKGDLIILDGPDSISASTIKKPSSPQVGKVPEEKKPSQLLPVSWILWISGGLFLITLIIIIAYIIGSEVSNRRKARRIYESQNI